jgi:hypothetical protein
LPALALVLAAAAFAQQQPIAPHSGYVYPAGGRQGSTFEVVVGGQALNGVNNAYLSGPGATVRIVEYERPMTNAQANDLREQAQALNQKRQANPATFPAEDMQKLLEIRDKLQKFIRRPMNPAIAETVRIEVALAADAAPGRRELRLATPNGMTNPLAFQVGTLPEWNRKTAEAITAPGVARPAQLRNITPSTSPTAPVEITLPVVVNGQVMPGAIDRYRFNATKGQKLVIAASARELIPYISDAVPGWFQATLALRDAAGKELQYADHYTFRPDPVLYYEIPADGAYTLEIKDSIYRGREDFVYRVEIGELPFLTSIFPLGAKTGARAAIDLLGWNLPASRVTKTYKAAGLEPITFPNANVVPFAVDTLPELSEKGTKQKLKLPVIVNGRITGPDEQDVYRVDGKAGDELVAEIVARRLGSPLDSILRLTDAKGKEIAVNDDTEDKASGLLTHHADSHLQVKLPANGTYYLTVADTQHKGGPEYGYRLRVSRPQPDFELRVTPSGINARSGLATPVSVYAIRRDGFDGEIAVKLEKAPAGFKLDGAVIPAGQSSVRMTLSAPPSHIEAPSELVFEGRATVAGREVRHAAIAADDMMQAFYYHHLTPATAVVVRVTGPQRPPVLWKAFTDKPVRLPAGGDATVQIPVPNRGLGGPVSIALNDPPDGITIQSVTPSRDGVAVVLRADPAKAKPGLKGNLILDAFVERTVQNAQKQQVRRKQPLGTLPAAPFEVVAP